MHKLGTLRGADDVPTIYPDIWDREPTTPERLVIAPASNHCTLLLDLANLWLQDSWLLYVLLLSRRDHKPGRYQSPDTVSGEQLQDFLDAYGCFLNSDGRHHFWIAAPDWEGGLVYDHHNVIYAYGPLESFEELLQSRGFHRAEVRVPVPHTHRYYAANDIYEARILDHWSWLYMPLQGGVDDT